jgi:hypothetical protein
VICKVERDADLVHLRTRRNIQLALMIAGVSFMENGVAFKNAKLDALNSGVQESSAREPRAREDTAST